MLPRAEGQVVLCSRDLFLGVSPTGPSRAAAVLLVDEVAYLLVDVVVDLLVDEVVDLPVDEVVDLPVGEVVDPLVDEVARNQVSARGYLR